MEINEEMEELKARMRILSKKKYKRFNTLLLAKNYEKLSELSERSGKSRSAVLNMIIEEK
jgi:predicted DNA-binding protein